MEKITRFLVDPAPAGRQKRSRAGLFLSILIAPMLLGIMACFVLPVPIGNPERGRIDPTLSGVWMGVGDELVVLLVLEPFDKRTWFVSWVFLEFADEVDSEAEVDINDIIEEGGHAAVYPVIDRWLQEDKIEIEHFMPFKGWLTNIRRERFITWEPKAVLWSEDRMRPDHWWVMRLRDVDENNFVLDFIDPEFEDLKEVQTSKEAERILRKNLENPDLYAENGEVYYRRIAHKDYVLLYDMLTERGISSNIEDL
ncbi:MAG: hypothetical protein ACE5OQ_01390 [Woeseia sp.]